MHTNTPAKGFCVASLADICASCDAFRGALAVNPKRLSPRLPHVANSQTIFAAGCATFSFVSDTFPPYRKAVHFRVCMFSLKERESVHPKTCVPHRLIIMLIEYVPAVCAWFLAFSTVGWSVGRTVGRSVGVHERTEIINSEMLETLGTMQTTTTTTTMKAMQNDYEMTVRHET